MRQIVLEAFQKQFAERPTWITRSPGRVNIIGEHTDYNDGFVLPMTINYDTWVALRPRRDSQVWIRSLDKNENLTFDLSHFTNKEGGWQEYIKGVAWALQEEGLDLLGWEGVFAGNVPIGAGLSSSAALELAAARAFALVSTLPWEPRQMALSCQKAENHWVGVNSGIMDQMVSACGRESYALMIDCRNLETQQVLLPERALIVILDTTTRRGLVESAYNERRTQCEEAARHFQADALRDVTLDQLREKKDSLDPLLYQRAKHVISENQRVIAAVKSLQEGNLQILGELMTASHASLRDDFEVSRAEMDQMVAIAQVQPGCFGARLTGAGFGGCAIALVKSELVDGFQAEVAREYQRATGLKPKVYISKSVAGTSYEKF